MNRQTLRLLSFVGLGSLLIALLELSVPSIIPLSPLLLTAGLVVVSPAIGFLLLCSATAVLVVVGGSVWLLGLAPLILLILWLVRFLVSDEPLGRQLLQATVLFGSSISLFILGGLIHRQMLQSLVMIYLLHQLLAIPLLLAIELVSRKA